MQHVSMAWFKGSIPEGVRPRPLRRAKSCLFFRRFLFSCRLRYFGAADENHADQQHTSQREHSQRKASFIRCTDIGGSVKAYERQGGCKRIDIPQQPLFEEQNAVSGNEREYRACHKQSRFPAAESDDRKNNDIDQNGEQDHPQQTVEKVRYIDIGKMRQKADDPCNDQAVYPEKNG